MLASGATAIAGFAALIASDIRMLRDFGIVTVVDLTVSLLGVMLVLPAALIWAEQRAAARASSALRRRGAAREPRRREPRTASRTSARERRAERGEQLAERDRTEPERAPPGGAAPGQQATPGSSASSA